MPFSLYSDFVLEAKFGFNKKTLKIFFMDLVKVLGLTICLGGPVLSLIILFFEKSGPMAWIYCWGLMVAFSLFTVFIFPKYLLPLFYELKPLEDGSLKESIRELSSRLDFSCKGYLVASSINRTIIIVNNKP